jgi:hypothetical protein
MTKYDSTGWVREFGCSIWLLSSFASCRSTLWPEFAEHIQLSLPRRFRAPIGQIDDHALLDSVEPGDKPVRFGRGDPGGPASLTKVRPDKFFMDLGSAPRGGLGSCSCQAI